MYGQSVKQGQLFLNFKWKADPCAQAIKKQLLR